MVDYQDQKRHWEGVRERRSPFHPVVAAFRDPKLGFVIASLPPSECQRSLLEVGAGNGFFSVALEVPFALTCLDFSQNMLRLCPVRRAAKVVGDAVRLPFSDGSFDVTCCTNLLHHLESPLQAVRELARVARRQVVVVEPNIQNPLMLAFGLLRREERGSLKFSSRYVRRLGQAAGLRLRSYAAQGSVVPNRTPLWLLPLLARLDGRSPLGFYHVAVFDV
jgi:SAM-dependent methyltransferase